jgi:hypothetical protein
MLKFKEFSALLEDLVPVSVGSEKVGDIESSDSAKIKYLVAKLSPGSNALKSKIMLIGYSEKEAIDLVHLMENETEQDLKVFADYLTSTTKPTIDQLTNKSDMYKLFNYELTGLSQKTLYTLFKHNVQTKSKGTGDGEVALSLLLSGGTKPLKSGDLLVNSLTYEVKGIGAKLAGQRGEVVKNPTGLRNAFVEGFSMLAKNVNLDLSTLRTKKYSYDDEHFWNFREGAWGSEIIAELLFKNTSSKEHNKTVESIKETYVNALYQIFPKSKMEIQKGIGNFVNNKGLIVDRSQFLQWIGKINANVYWHTHKPNGMVFLNMDSKNSSIIAFPSVDALNSAIDETEITISGMSFEDKADRSILPGFTLK